MSSNDPTQPTPITPSQMWVRIAAAIEREAQAAPEGKDRDLALEWAAQLRRRLKPRSLPGDDV
jgi:hypothetical protein